MSKNIEKQGKRPGYIVGGILATLLGAFLLALYLPSFLTTAFGIAPLWDATGFFTSLLGANIMQFLIETGPIILLGMFLLLYFVSFSARPSSSSTMFRFSAIFSVLSLSLPYIVIFISAYAGELELTNIIAYANIALLVLGLIFYVIGLILRSTKKFHKNRATTLLVFSATFWLVLNAVATLPYIAALMGMVSETITNISALTLVNINAIIGIFLIISAIWQFITIPHRVRVEYNTTTPSKNSRPVVIPVEESKTTLDPATPQRQPLEQNSSFNNNPVFNATNEVTVTTQPLNAYPQTNRPVVQPQTTNPFAQSNRPTTMPPRPVMPTPPQQQNINSNYTRPQPQNTGYNPFANSNALPPRPIQQAPAPRPMQNIPPRPVQPQQQFANPFTKPAQTPRPPVTPFANQNSFPKTAPNYTSPLRPANPQAIANNTNNQMPPRPVQPAQAPRPMPQPNYPRPVAQNPNNLPPRPMAQPQNNYPRPMPNPYNTQPQNQNPRPINPVNPNARPTNPNNNGNGPQ